MIGEPIPAKKEALQQFCGNPVNFIGVPPDDCLMIDIAGDGRSRISHGFLKNGLMVPYGEIKGNDGHNRLEY